MDPKASVLPTAPQRLTYVWMYVWRRLAAKAACTQLKVANASLLAPRQLDFEYLGERKQQFVQ